MGATASAACCAADGSTPPRSGGRVLLRKTPAGGARQGANAYTSSGSVMWTAEEMCGRREEGRVFEPVDAPLFDMGLCEMRSSSPNPGGEGVIVHLRTPPPSERRPHVNPADAAAATEDAEDVALADMAIRTPTKPVSRGMPSPAKSKRLPASPAASGEEPPPWSSGRHAPPRMATNRRVFGPRVLPGAHPAQVTEMCCGYRGGLVFKAHRLLYHSA